MTSLTPWHEKIIAKRTESTFRGFLMEIASWFTFVLYRKQGKVSKYPENNRFLNTVPYEEFVWLRDTLLSYWQDYDPQRSFFEQFHEFINKVPSPNLPKYWLTENASFWNEVLNSKNVYLSTLVVMDCWDVFYSANVKENSHTVFNSNMVRNNSSDVYSSAWILESTSIFYSRFIRNSYNIWFSSNLIWCNNCFLCEHLENQSYCIKNQQYTKEEYEKEKERLLSHKESFEKRFSELSSTWANHGSHGVTGAFIHDSENVKNWYMSYQIKHGKNVLIRWGKWVNENVWDIIWWWTVWNDYLYWVNWAWAWSHHIYCSSHVVWSHVYYSYYLSDCSYCFWCVWLLNKQFCIFNKQYTKEEWFDKIEEIFLSMERSGELGAFFPWSMCPYYFNDTAAYLIDSSFTKEEVSQHWYLWREDNITIDVPTTAKIISYQELSSFEKNTSDWWGIDPSILKMVIQWPHWWYYRIIQQEYDFLMKYQLPLPRKHRLERLRDWFQFIWK